MKLILAVIATFAVSGLVVGQTALDASCGSVFLNLLGATEGVLNRTAT